MSMIYALSEQSEHFTYRTWIMVQLLKYVDFAIINADKPI